MIDQTTPLVPDPDNPGWAKRIQLDDVIAKRDKLAALLGECLQPLSDGGCARLITRIEAVLTELQPKAHGDS